MHCSNQKWHDHGCAGGNQSFQPPSMLLKESLGAVGVVERRSSEAERPAAVETEAQNLHAGSEDSSMSCPGLFTAEQASTASAQHPGFGAAEVVPERESSVDMRREEEARLAALKTRKDAAAHDVKQYIDRW